ncbi:hypothetical protein ACFVH4_08630 [Nocardia ignorata]|uniref:hypothetical protein n=1 Tax=Nocardia ignorata TaxID=145285 RepID=UPI00362D5139
MATIVQPATRRALSALWGVGAGFVLAVFVFVPAVYFLQRQLEVPEISATPSHLRARPPVVHPAYWLTWILTFTTLLAPSVFLALWSSTRRAALGYVITAAVLGGSLMALTISFELGGFAPS